MPSATGCFIGRAFVRESLGLKTLSPHHCAVYLGALLIGELHAKDAAGMLVSASRGDELS